METLQNLSASLWPPLRYLLRRFGQDRCSDNAAALTYMSLFALVPSLTVLYTMASAIPAFQGVETRIQEIVFQHLLPETSYELESYLNDFSRQAKNLTGFGIAVLVATAILMLRNIEKAFNLIWRTRENRSPVSSFLIYWAVLSLAPLTFGAALAIGTYLASLAVIVEDYDIIGAGDLLLKTAPFLLSSMGFTLLYNTVPNCRVPFRHALIGGAAAALAFNTARSLFTDLVVGSNYTFIYGAFAAVPLFLLWIYLSWVIVLMGAVLVHSLSAYQSSEQAARPSVLKALDVLYLFWRRQHEGRPVRELELLHTRIDVVKGIDSETWRDLREIFLARKLITRDHRGHYFLSRDLHGVYCWQIKEWVNAELPLDNAADEAQLSWQQHAQKLLLTQRQQQRELMNLNLVELFES